MSRIGNTPVIVPKDVIVTLHDTSVGVKGPKGEITLAIPYGIHVKQGDGVLNVERLGETKNHKALHGTTSALLANAMVGVTKGWTKQLELSGVGYRVALAGTSLTFTVGFSHPVTIAPPEGITFTVVDGKVVVSGIDKYRVGQISATIRKIKPPEPYKGKGIRYSGEYVRKKAGKSAKAVGGAPGAK
ncbi:50S ribosomal protein L6 [Candidatus Woesebacteria bacterium]|jgi:large subunit ribosomal protein L6|nr:50S ribosomal protein L6 [Candidatus Woesebacteria bacterium]